jgi:hypothetical protein
MNPETVFATSLESAKEGETVIRANGGYGSTKIPRVITRTTPTLIFLGEIAYHRKNGYEKGGGSIYSRDRIHVTNKEELDALEGERERKRLVSLFRESREWETFTLDQLRQVSALCLSFKPAP